MASRNQFRVSRREFLALSGALVPCLAAQDATFSADVKVVSVLATVRDKQGEIVRTLTQQDFKIDEDGKAQTIKYFSQQTDLGLTLGLLVDTSGSQRMVLGEERVASLRFLRSVMREDRDMAFVIHFDGEVELLQDLTSSRTELEKSLDDPSMEGPSWQRRGTGRTRPPVSNSSAGTALYDAILLASDDMLRKQQGRKAVILLSDGDDQGSKVTLSRSIEAAQRADTLVYSIYFGRENMFFRPAGGGGYGGRRRGGTMGSQPPIVFQPSQRNGIKVMQRISRETGGAFFQVSEKMPLDKIYKRIEEELRSQYNLGYNSSQTGSGYRKIKVAVAQKGLNVQSREGYYSE